MPISNNFRDKDNAAWKENATDGGTDRRTCDITAHDKLDQIITALGASAGTPVFDDAFNVATTGSGNTVNLISTTVTAAKTRTFINLNCSSRVGGRFEVKLAGSIIAVAETGAGNYNAQFDFKSLRTGTGGQSITVDFIQVQGATGAPVSASLTSTEQ